jgi:hypothetical protein
MLNRDRLQKFQRPSLTGVPNGSFNAPAIHGPRPLPIHSAVIMWAWEPLDCPAPTHLFGTEQQIKIANPCLKPDLPSFATVAQEDADRGLKLSKAQASACRACCSRCSADLSPIIGLAQRFDQGQLVGRRGCFHANSRGGHVVWTEPRDRHGPWVSRAARRRSGAARATNPVARSPWRRGLSLFCLTGRESQMGQIAPVLSATSGEPSSGMRCSGQFSTDH